MHDLFVQYLRLKPKPRVYQDSGPKLIGSSNAETIDTYLPTEGGLPNRVCHGNGGYFDMRTFYLLHE